MVARTVVGPNIGIWAQAHSGLFVPVSCDANGHLNVNTSPATSPVAVSLANGADVAEGSTTDVAVTGDNPGTLSAKLRGIDKILTAVWNSTESRLRTNAWPPELSVSFWNNLNGKTSYIYQILGARSQGWSSTSVWGDIADYLDTSQPLINTPTSGQTLYLYSSSASDTAAGTGARTVKTVYLDGSGNQLTRTDTLNGSSAVSIGSGYTAIQWMETVTAGSGGVAAGNVTISSANGSPSVSNTFEQMTAGGNRSGSMRYVVPTGYSAYLISWTPSVLSPSQNINTRLVSDSLTDNNAATTGVFHLKDGLYMASGQNAQLDLYFIKMPAGCTIKAQGLPGAVAAGNIANIGLHFIINQN
jgi:hypothetical protein